MPKLIKIDFANKLYEIKFDYESVTYSFDKCYIDDDFIEVYYQYGIIKFDTVSSEQILQIRFKDIAKSSYLMTYRKMLKFKLFNLNKKDFSTQIDKVVELFIIKHNLLDKPLFVAYTILEHLFEQIEILSVIPKSIEFKNKKKLITKVIFKIGHTVFEKEFYGMKYDNVTKKNAWESIIVNKRIKFLLEKYGKKNS